MIKSKGKNEENQGMRFISPIKQLVLIYKPTRAEIINGMRQIKYGLAVEFEPMGDQGEFNTVNITPLKKRKEIENFILNHSEYGKSIFKWSPPVTVKYIKAEEGDPEAFKMPADHPQVKKLLEEEKVK